MLERKKFLDKTLPPYLGHSDTTSKSDTFIDCVNYFENEQNPFLKSIKTW